ncbi:RNA helicase [Tersicoccus sp. Bi-70]|uniref:DEAD/DEAH box helicase n=1 Tax=Tersicoccus sp. Bi-70 TaxID=1897634 RepID=UPI000976B93E|nr:DEAD/DEAH box helicase [Tersicoccus sp. Bi-70]OMH33008.1 RNA helicase [Tersicoccus sp. Bi-70]
MSTPSERYAAARERNQYAKTRLAAFERTQSFDLDEFQRQACRCLEAGHGVLVAAPTGAGKTVVGEFAIHLALEDGLKAFYTTPIKALSNQKYAELVAVHGPDRVGLLTGDTSINPEADVVVMTTEVLRNMLYASSSTLDGLGYVVMDEVHYLADRFRGAVWEEVIIHLPDSVRVVSLSATVSNAEEFGAWLDTVRGETDVIVSEHRPVPLWQHVMVGDRIVDLFATPTSFDAAAIAAPAGESTGESAGENGGENGSRGSGADRADRDDARGRDIKDGRHRSSGGRPSSKAKDRRRTEALRQQEQRARAAATRTEQQDSGITVNPELNRLARTESRVPRQAHRGRGRRPDRPPVRESVRRASRPAMIRQLDREALLPAIVFIFSRAGCDAAVRQCVDADLWLTTRAEQRQIREELDEAVRELSPEDLEVLGFWTWRDGLMRGIAAHHAGMLPPFKEVVERLFGAGIVKVVFATETLALGVNMPARSVVLEKLEKFNGEAHVPVTAGEYTQLTGRAGRRGIDIEGHAVVLWQPGTDPSAVAGLASRRTYPLNSSFRPTYNMSINLIAQFGRDTAREILESSFAQFQADRSVVGIARQIRSREESLAGYAESMRCHLGDFSAYARLRRELSDAEQRAASTRTRRTRDAAMASLDRLRPGDVIEVPTGRSAGFVVVIRPETNGYEPRTTVLTLGHQVRRITAQDLHGEVRTVGSVRIPQHFDARNPRERRDLASSLRNALHDQRPERGGRHATAAADDAQEARIADLRRQVRSHPCHGCSDREQHARWAERWHRLDRETEGLKRQIKGRTNTIARTFDTVCDVLAGYGYLTDAPVPETEDPEASRHIGELLLDGTDPAPDGDRTPGPLRITPDGSRLRRIYGEKDLLIALCLGDGVFDALDPEELAALASVLVYQAKREERGVRPTMPTPALEDAVRGVVRRWSELTDVEEAAGLPETSEPELGLARPMIAWARGRTLQEALRGTDLAAGDFVRWSKQVIDLLDQLAGVPEIPTRLRSRLRSSIDLVRRGVVAYSAVAA